MFKFPFYTDKADDLKWGEITATYPWIKDMLDVEQDPIWHAEGNVNTHTRMVTQALLRLPGAGKSTYIKNKYGSHPVVSMDAIRREKNVRRGNKKEEGRMLQEVKELAKSYLRKSTPFVWNATNITRNDRGKLIDMAVTYKYKVKIVYIEPDYKTLLQQNSEREYKAPESTIKGYLRGLEVPSPSEAYVVKYITPDAKTTNPST